MEQEKIGKFIAEIRKDKKLTQAQLAKKIGVTDRAISKWENGRGMPDLSLMKPLCNELGITINELLCGEKIAGDDYQKKFEENIFNTINYSENKIKKNRIKNIVFTVFVIILLFCVVLFSYKFYLLNKYTLEKPINVSNVINGLKNQKTINIYKRTINSNYFSMSGFKIRNDFDGYVLNERDSEYQPYLMRKEEDGKIYTIGYDSGKENNYQMIDYFVNDAVIISNEKEGSLENFNSADRKYFLLKNDINNDLDFYNYIANNYFIENDIFMDKRTMMENYSFNLFVSVMMPEINRMTIIKGDYEGFIFYLDNNVIQVSIIRDDKIYGFYTNDGRFQDETYLIDILGTIEFNEA